MKFHQKWTFWLKTIVISLVFNGKIIPSGICLRVDGFGFFQWEIHSLGIFGGNMNVLNMFGGGPFSQIQDKDINSCYSSIN